ncbi:hypothetical protein HanHA300_Chr10g0371821 [Helianthus annuus]|uniref:Uncharacterized protein n=1 Tax=Helianthus annuus TaxID=4232 RepID=A0A251TMH5_HELAN|nr:hypothetical protein HanHA300_Chr10g0371821 [Helianthus annuus]
MCGFFFGLTGLVITHLVSKLTMLVVMEDVHFLLLEPKLILDLKMDPVNQAFGKSFHVEFTACP